MIQTLPMMENLEKEQRGSKVVSTVNERLSSFPFSLLLTALLSVLTH